MEQVRPDNEAHLSSQTAQFLAIHILWEQKTNRVCLLLAGQYKDLLSGSEWDGHNVEMDRGEE